MKCIKKVIDLHLHTTASDGVKTPEQLVEKAYQNGLAAIAVTDHDTIDGLLKAEEKASELGIELVKGVEFTTNYEPVMHIIGLNLDIQNKELKELLHKLDKSRLRLLAKALRHVKENGIDVTAKDICEEKGTVTILNLKNYLLEKNMVETGDDLDLDLLSIINEWRAVTPSPSECIQLIHGCNGIAILAHPALLSREYVHLKQIVLQLKQYGLDGIEVIHPSHTTQERAIFKTWAEELKLFQSGGSDYHGVGKRIHTGSSNPEDDIYVSYSFLEEMKGCNV